MKNLSYLFIVSSIYCHLSRLTIKVFPGFFLINFCLFNAADKYKIWLDSNLGSLVLEISDPLYLRKSMNQAKQIWLIFVHICTGWLQGWINISSAYLSHSLLPALLPHLTTLPNFKIDSECDALSIYES